MFNIVVGMVARVNDGFSHTLVKGVWLFYDLAFESFNVTIDQLRDIFMHVKVFKVGVQTGLTEGTVKFVDNNLLMVQGDNETVFAKPGDSGSLVFIKHEG